MARWRRADLDASSPSTVPRPCSATQLICCFARELVDRDKGGRPPDDADRPRSRSSGRLCGITRRRLPNRRFRLPGLHLGSCPAHRERRATWAGRPGRLVRGKPQPKPYSAPRAACHRTPGQPRQRAGGHAPQPAGPSDAARPNRTLSAAASNAAPTPPLLEVRSTLNRHKPIFLHGYSAKFWKSIPLLQQYLP